MNLLGLIGGTGLDQWGGLESEMGFETPYGSPSAPVAYYEIGASHLLFLARHSHNHSIPPHRVNYRANIHALHQAGVKQVLGINAVGGITERFGAGTMAVPDQLVDYTWGREQSYSDGTTFGLQHIEFAEPFAGPLRQRVLAAAADLKLNVVDGGCVAVVQGPRLETAAEICRLREDGSDMVGMTTMPEAALARELGMDYTALCVVSNKAADKAEEPITMEEIHANLAQAIGKVRAIVEYLCQHPEESAERETG